MANKQYLIELAVKDDKLKSSLKKSLESTDVQKTLGILGEGITEHLEKDIDKATSILGKVDWASLLGKKDFEHLQQLVAKTVSANKDLIKSFVKSNDTQGIQNAIELVSALGSELKAINPDVTVAGLARSMASFMKVIAPLEGQLNGLKDAPVQIANAFGGMVNSVDKSLTSVYNRAGKTIEKMNNDVLKHLRTQLDAAGESIIKYQIDDTDLNEYINKFVDAQAVAEELNKEIENSQTALRKLSKAETRDASTMLSLVKHEQKINALMSKLSALQPSIDGKSITKEIDVTVEQVVDKLEKSFNKLIEDKLSSIKVKIDVPTEDALIADLNTVIEKVNKKGTSSLKLVGAESAINEAQKKILANTQEWHNHMKDALKFSKKEDIELDLGVRLREIGTDVGEDLRRSIEEYFDNPTNKVAIPVELILTGENKAILEGGGNITINGGTGGGEITAESLAKALTTPIEVKVQEEQKSSKPTSKLISLDYESAFAQEVIDVFDELFKAIERGGENAQKIAQFFELKGIDLSKLKSMPDSVKSLEILKAYESFLENGDKSILDDVDTRLAKGGTKNVATTAFRNLLRDSIFRFNLDNITTQEDNKRRAVRDIVLDDYVPRSMAQESIYKLRRTDVDNYKLPTVEELDTLIADLPQVWGTLGSEFVPALEVLKQLRGTITDPNNKDAIQNFKDAANKFALETQQLYQAMKTEMKSYRIGVFNKGHSEFNRNYDRLYNGGVGSGSKILEYLDKIDYFELYDDPSGHFSGGNRQDVLDRGSRFERYQLRKEARNASYRSREPEKTSVLAEDIEVVKFEPKTRSDEQLQEINAAKAEAQKRVKALDDARKASVEEAKAAEALRKQELEAAKKRRTALRSQRTKTENKIKNATPEVDVLALQNQKVQLDKEIAELDAKISANSVEQTKTPTVLQQLSQLPKETEIQQMRNDVEGIDKKIEDAQLEAEELDKFINEHFKEEKYNVAYTKQEKKNFDTTNTQNSRLKVLGEALDEKSRVKLSSTSGLTQKDREVASRLFNDRKIYQLINGEDGLGLPINSRLEDAAKNRIEIYQNGLSKVDEFLLKHQDKTLKYVKDDEDLTKFMKDDNVRKVLAGTFAGSKEDESTIREQIDSFKNSMTKAGKSYIVDYIDMWSDKNLREFMKKDGIDTRTSSDAMGSSILQEFYRRIIEGGVTDRDKAYQYLQNESVKYQKQIKKDEGSLEKLVVSAWEQAGVSETKDETSLNRLKDKYKGYADLWLHTIQQNMYDIMFGELDDKDIALKHKKNDELRVLLSSFADKYFQQFGEVLLTENQSALFSGMKPGYTNFLKQGTDILTTERDTKQNNVDIIIQEKAELLRRRRFDLLKQISSRVGKGEDTASLEKSLSDVESELIKYSDELPYILQNEFEADLLNAKNATEEEWRQFRDNATKRRNEFDSSRYTELKGKQTSILKEIAQKTQDGESTDDLVKQLNNINKEIVQYEVNTSRLKDVEFAKFPNDASVATIRTYNNEMEELVRLQQKYELLKAKNEDTTVIERDIAKQKRRLKSRVGSSINEDKRIAAEYAPSHQAADFIERTDRAAYILDQQEKEAKRKLDAARANLEKMQSDEYKNSRIYRSRIESLKNQAVTEYVRSDEYKSTRDRGVAQADQELGVYLAEQLGEDVAKRIVYELSTNKDRADVESILNGDGNTTRLVENAFKDALKEARQTAYEQQSVKYKGERENTIDEKLAGDKATLDAKIQEIWNQTKADLAKLRQADMANSEELRSAVFAEAEKAGMGDSSEYRRSIVEQVRERLIQERIETGRQEQKFYNAQYYEKARAMRAELSPAMYQKINEESDRIAYETVMAKLQDLIGDKAGLLKGLEGKREELIKTYVGDLVEQYRQRLTFEETNIYQGVNIREMVERELANEVAFYEQQYIDASGKAGVLRHERDRAKAFGELGYDETLNPEITKVRAEAEARLSAEKEKQVELTERLTNLTAQNADRNVVHAVSAELQATEKEILRLQLLSQGASNALTLRKEAREEELESNKFTPDQVRLWLIDHIEEAKKTLESGTDKEKERAANNIAKWEQKLANIEKVIEASKPEVEKPRTVLDMITHAIRDGLAGVTAGGNVDLDASLYNIATETTLQEILRLLGGNGAVEYANQLKAELAKDRPRYEKRHTTNGNEGDRSTNGKKAKVNKDLDKLNADGQRIYGELDAQAKLFTDNLKNSSKKYDADFDFVKAIRNQAAVVKKQTKGSLEYIQEQTKLTVLYQDYYRKTFGKGRKKKGQPGQAAWAEKGELGKIAGLKDLLLFKSKRADALVGLNYGIAGSVKADEVTSDNKPNNKTKQNKKSSNKRSTKVAVTNDDVSDSNQVVAEATAKALAAKGITNISAEDIEDLGQLVNAAIAKAMEEEGLGRDDDGKKKKTHPEYNDAISVGYDRIQKLQKIREGGVVGSRSTEDLLRVGHTVWDKVKDNNFFSDIPENNLQKSSKIVEVIRATVNEILQYIGVTEEQLVQQLQNIKNATGGRFKNFDSGLGWTRFATYNENGNQNKIRKENGLTYKVYASFENIQDLNENIVSSILKELSDAGFKGQLKTTTGSTGAGDKLNAIVNTDQLVVHGASKNDQEIAYNVLKKMGLNLSYLSGGIDTPDGSFTQTLASNSIGKYVAVRSEQVSVEPEIAPGAVAEEVKENVEQKPPVADVKPEVKPNAVEKEVKKNTKPTRSTTNKNPNTTHVAYENANSSASDKKLPYDIDPNSLIGRLQNTVGGSSKPLAEQETLSLVLHELQEISKKIPSVGKAGVKSSAQSLLEEFQKMAAGSAMDTKERVSYFDLVNGAMSPALSGTPTSVPQKLLDTLSQQYGVNKGYRSQVHTHADSNQTWFSKKDLEHFKKNLGGFGADSIKQQVLLTKDNITVFDMTMVETAEKAAQAIDILKSAGSNINNDTLEKLVGIGARYQSKSLDTISAKGLMDLLGVKNYKNDGKKQGAIADPEAALAGLESYAQLNADQRNSKYVFNSFDGETLKYQLVDVEGHISKVVLAWDELEKKVRVVSDTSTSSIDSTVKKIQQYRAEIENAKNEKLLSDGDDVNFVEAEQEVDKILKQIETGDLSGQKLSEAINELETARAKLAEEGDKLHKLIAKNNKLRSGTTEVKSAITQGTKVRSVLGDNIDVTEKDGVQLFSADDDTPEYLKRYVQAYNELVNVQQKYIKDGQINNPKIQDALKVQATIVKKLGAEAITAYQRTVQLQEKSSTWASQTYVDKSGVEHALGGDTYVGGQMPDRAAMLQYAKEVLGADLASAKLNTTTGKLTGVLRKNNYVVADMAVEYDKTTGKMHLYQEAEKESLGGLPGFINALKAKSKAIWQYLMSMTSIYRIFGELRKGIQYIREIDAALTELKKVTDETEKTYDRFLNTAAKTADKVGSTIKEVVSSTADWARIGYSLEDAATLAESTAVLLNVSEFQSIDEATSALTSTLQAFGYTANESMKVVDVMNEVGNNFAISSDGIATALQDSASSLMAANNSYEQAVALIAAANRVVQDPNSVGAALRTISLRLRGTSVKELEEAGEDTTGAVESTSKLRSKVKSLSGVDILTDTGAYKDTYTVLLEISKVWKDMSDINQAALLELIAGKTRSNTAAAILSNTKDLEEAYESAMKAQGSAYAENEKYLDSIQGRIDLFNNSVQTMWNNTLDSGVVKGVVDIGTGLVKIVDQLGLVKTLVIAIGTYLIQKHFKGDLFGGLFGNIQVADNGMKKAFEKLKKSNSAKVKKHSKPLEEYGAKSKELKNLKRERKTIQQKLSNTSDKNEAQKLNKQLKTNNENIKKTKKSLGELGQSAKKASNAINGPMQKLSVNFKKVEIGIKNATKAVWKFSKEMLQSMAYMYVITTVIELVSIGINKLIELISNSVESFENLQDKFEEARNEVDSIKSDIQDLESELKTTDERIEELNEQGTLTFVEQEELSRLQQVSNELKTQLELKQKIQDSLQKGANDAAIVAANKYMDTSFANEKTKSEVEEEGAETGGFWGKLAGAALIVGGLALAPFSAGTSTGATVAGLSMIGLGLGAESIGSAVGSAVAGSGYDSEQNVGEAIDKMNVERDKLIKARDEALAAYADGSGSEEAYNSAEQELIEYNANLANAMTKIAEYRNQIVSDWDSAAPEQKEQARQWGDMLDAYSIEVGGEDAITNAISRMFGKEATEDIQGVGNELKQLVDDGKEIDWSEIFDDENKLKAFQSRLFYMGLTLADIEYYFKDAKKAEEEMENSDLWDMITQVNKLKDGVNGLTSAFNEFINGGVITASTLTELYNTLGIAANTDLAEPWKEYVKVMASGTASTEEAREATKNLMESIINSNLSSAMTDMNAYTGLIAQLEALGMTNAKKYVDALMKKNVADEIAGKIVNEDGILKENKDEIIKEIKDKYSGVVDVEDEIIAKAQEKVEKESIAKQKKQQKTAYDAAVKENERRKDKREVAQSEITSLSDKTNEELGITRVWIGSTGSQVNPRQQVWKYNGTIYYAETDARNKAYDAKKQQLQQTIDSNQEQELPVEVTPTEVENAENAVTTVVGEYATMLDEYNLELEVSLPTPGEALDKLQSVFDTLKDAVKEFNENGYLSVDTVQTLLDPEQIDSKYLSLLMDENGQLQLNEEAILAVAKARLTDLGIQRATSVITTMENALTADSIERAKELTTVTHNLTEDTWDFVESEAARVAILMQEKGMTSDEIASFTNQIAAIRNMTESARNNMSNAMSSSGNTAKSEAEEAFQRAMTYWENRIGANQARYEQVQNEIDLLEKQGKTAGKEYYEEQINLENERLKLLEAQKKEAEGYLGRFSEGSDEWWSVANQLNDIEGEIDGVTSSILELSDAMAEVDWKVFDETSERFSKLHDELSTIRDLIAPNGEEDWFDDEGMWTDKGTASLATYITDLQDYEVELARVNEELEKYSLPYAGNEEAYAKLGIHSEQELYDAREKLIDQQYDIRKAQSDTQQSVADMYESQIDAVEEYTNKLVESYNDYIDVVKEALDAERDLYEFKKDIQKQTKDIASLERRIASLSGSDNAADIAERRKLEAELYEAREGLNDTYYSHAKDSQQQALEDEAAAYEESMNKFVEGLRTSLESALVDMDLFMQGVTSAVTSNAPAIVEQYNGLGIALNGAIIDPWKEAAAKIEEFGGADGLGIMNSWINEGGVFPTFKSDATTALTSPWTEGEKAIDSFKTSVANKMDEVLANVSSNVTQITSKLGEVSSAYDGIIETTLRAPIPVIPGGGDGGGDTPPSSDDVKALQQILNSVFFKKLTVDGKYGEKTQTAVSEVQEELKRTVAPSLTVNGRYNNETKLAMAKWMDAKITEMKNGKYGGTSAIGQGVRYYTEQKNKLPKAFYAKGTLGTKRDEFAITDESWIGEEITLAAGKNGQLQYLKKGSAVMPADISANLVEWGKLNPEMMNVGGTPNINMISNAVNKPEFKIDVENFLRCDNVSQDTLPELKRFVNEQMNSLMKQLNYGLKKAGAR